MISRPSFWPRAPVALYGEMPWLVSAVVSNQMSYEASQACCVPSEPSGFPNWVLYEVFHSVGMLVTVDSFLGNTFGSVFPEVSGFGAVGIDDPWVQLFASQLQPLKVET